MVATIYFPTSLEKERLDGAEGKIGVVEFLIAGVRTIVCGSRFWVLNAAVGENKYAPVEFLLEETGRLGDTVVRYISIYEDDLCALALRFQRRLLDSPLVVVVFFLLQ